MEVEVKVEGWSGTCTPEFFVSVASKGLSVPASSLFATLTRWLVNVADNGVRKGWMRPKHGKTRRSFVNVAAKGVTEAIFASVAGKGVTGGELRRCCR